MGFLEIGGIGFVAGVLSGAGAALAGNAFETVLPYCAAIGTVGVPVLWFGAGVRLSRLLRRPRTTRVVPAAGGLIA